MRLVLIGNYEALLSDPSQATFTVVQLFEDHEEVHPRGSLAVRDGRAICHFGIRGTPLYLVDLDAGRLEAGWHPSVAREFSVACSLTQTNYLSCIQADDASLFVATDFNSDWPGLSTWDFGTVAPAEQPAASPRCRGASSSIWTRTRTTTSMRSRASQPSSSRTGSSTTTCGGAGSKRGRSGRSRSGICPSPDGCRPRLRDHLAMVGVASS